MRERVAELEIYLETLHTALHTLTAGAVLPAILTGVVKEREAVNLALSVVQAMLCGHTIRAAGAAVANNHPLGAALQTFLNAAEAQGEKALAAALECERKRVAEKGRTVMR